MNKKDKFDQYPDKQIDHSQNSKPNGKGYKIEKGNLVKNLGDNFYQTYLKQKFIGSGAYGTVHLIIHRQLKIKRALKAIRKYNGARSTKQQLQLLKKMDHPNILNIIQYFETQEQWLIVTQYFQGKQLIQQVLQNKLLSEKKTALIVYEILKALNYIHGMNVAHRDIKAENVLVKKCKDGYEVKLIDWGFGALVPKHNFQRKCGTTYYMAPQVIKGDYGLECDMWSLGILVYTMLSGNFPFGGVNSTQTYGNIQKSQINFKQAAWSSISQQSKQFILSLLRKDVSKRLTAKQALQHPWIKQNLQVQDEETEIILKETLSNLKYFYNFNKLQIIILNYINNFIELPKNQSKLKKQFDYLDKNKDGTIGKGQFIEVYRKIYGVVADDIVKAIFEMVDFDDSGEITYSQFVTFGTQLKTQITEDELKEAFKLFDQDGDGLVDTQHITTLITSSLQPNQPLPQIDSNNDGKIDCNQFINYIQHAIKSSKQLKQLMHTQSNT